MLNKIEKELLTLTPDIKLHFANSAYDYKGRVISLDHVLSYFHRDLYRCIDIIKLIKDTGIRDEMVGHEDDHISN